MGECLITRRNGGQKVILGSKRIKNDVTISVRTNQIEYPSLPNRLDEGCAVVYDGRIHIIRGINESDLEVWKCYLNHNTWTEVDFTGDSFCKNSCSVVYDDKLFVLGGSVYPKMLYYWDETPVCGTNVIPYNFSQGCAVVWNDKIHLLGGAEKSKYHYTYTLDGATDIWTKCGTLPYDFYDGSAVVWNDEIHILGGGENKRKHYKYAYDTDSNKYDWVPVGTDGENLPYDFHKGCAVVYSGRIYIMGSKTTGNKTKIYYTSDGINWTEGSAALPYDFYDGSAVVFRNNLYILGGPTATTNDNFYSIRQSEFKLT